MKEKSFFGHPAGLSTLFFTEMWERFSYYGMRALLLLYMVTSVKNGGMGLDEKTGGAIYGLYTMLVYLLALPGGWLADKLFGLRNAVFYGGCIITLGHACMAVDSHTFFFIGLLLIALGTGLLKPNISTLVGQLYPEGGDARRDAGFSIFFLGINVGAFVSPFITGYLGETINWHYGFAVAGGGMLFGIIQFKLSEKNLADVGAVIPATVSTREKRIARNALYTFCSVIVLFVSLVISEVIVVNPIAVSRYSAVILMCCTAVYFIYLFSLAGLTSAEKKSVATIAFFFSASILFYMGYEQQGSSLNLFAKRYTDMAIGSFEMPASWMQSVPAVAVIILSPLFAWLWVWLSGRGANPSTAKKMSMALFSIGISYVIMSGASIIVVNGGRPLPVWLIFTYLFHTFGEICLYPVGLSAVSKLAPRRFKGQLMGVWFLSLSLGSLMAGIVAGQMNEIAVSTDPFTLVRFFGFLAGVSFLSALIIYFSSSWLRRLQPS
jgi:proton-dependent oligopeptide transporter, POT family